MKQISKEALLQHQLSHYAERFSKAKSVKERRFLRQQLHLLKKGDKQSNR